jgi:serine/threonine protein kinase
LREDYALRQEPDATLREDPTGSLTIRETGLSPAETDATRPDAAYGAVTVKQDADPHRGIAGIPESFRGWRVVDQLPTKGAEADLYIVSTGGALNGRDLCVLKLYRHRLEPKLEILNRITEISRGNSRCFVIFLETGFDEETGRWYELQEYIPLGSLNDVPSETKRSRDFILKLIPELAEAIRTLHENGIVHCDMKPANVLVRSLEPLDAILTDFGISSLLASDMSRKMTALKGTPMYWAPEAFSRVVGRPCDWWGLGMILLELAAGEHPLEGLSDSQIIHKLTLGNVEAPESLDPKLAMLIKGLLTKDDAKRWGYGEVTRWLAGDTDIPVYYEEAPIVYAQSGSRNPFRFDGKDYHSAEELALEWAVNEKPWMSGPTYLLYLRQWYESNLAFDEALETGNMISMMDPVTALFHFVHSSAKCPFSIMGKVVDAGNLRLFLGRAIRRESSDAEEQIIGMLGSGKLRSYYDEYVSLTGGADEALLSILEFMDKKTITEQWDYFDAIENPDAYVWPEDAGHETTGERTQALRIIGAVPMKRVSLDDITKKYTLPSAVLSMLLAASTHADGAKRIESWRSQGLLIPAEQQDQSRLYANMSEEEYLLSARIRCLGHTAMILERLDFLADALAKYYGAHATVGLMRAIERVRRMRDRKIDSRDILFIIKMSALLEGRQAIENNRSMLARYAASASLTATIFSLLRFAVGHSLDMPILAALVLFVVVGATYYVFFVRESLEETHYDQTDPVVTFFFFGVVAVIRFSGYLMSNAPGVTAMFTGAVYGLFACHIWRRFRLFRNECDITDAYDSYLFPGAGKDT